METKAKPVPKSRGREALSWALTLAAAILIALLIRTAVAEPIAVKGYSMLETLDSQEIMLVTKFDYLLGEPERFDVVVCRYPNRTERFVKRIVGLPGDEISISDGVLTVNGVAYPEDYLTYRPNYTLPTQVIPQGHYFVLGDNRSNSTDSHVIGTLTRAQIIGHVRAVVFPFDSWRTIE